MAFKFSNVCPCTVVDLHPDVVEEVEGHVYHEDAEETPRHVLRAAPHDDQQSHRTVN